MTDSSKETQTLSSTASEDKSSPLLNLLSRRLDQEDQARVLIEIAIDYLLHLPLNRYLDLDLLLETMREAYDPHTLTVLLRRVAPQVIQHLRELETDELRPLKDWITSEIDAELITFVIRAQLLNAERVQKWAHHPITRHVTRAFVIETLDRFIERVKPGAEGGGLLSAAGRGAFGFAQRASRGVLGGIADQLQGQLKSLTSDFVSASMGALLDQLALIVNTPEVAQLLAEAQLGAYQELISQPLSTLINALRREVPEWSEEEVLEWSELIADWMGHVITQPEISLWINEIQRQLIAEIGDQSISALVGSEELLNTCKRALGETLTPHLQAFIATPQFIDWCRHES